MLTDGTGYFAQWIIGGVIGAAIGAVGAGVYSYYRYGEVNWELVAAGAITGALVGSGIGLLLSATSSSMGTVAAATVGKNALASGLAQLQSNGINGAPALSGITGALVGGAFSAIPGLGAIGLSGSANAFINEFENEIFRDNDSEVFTWNSVGYETAMYSMANYYGYRVGYRGTPNQKVFTNYVFDTIIYPVSDSNRSRMYP
jgi:hypothetical protein